MGKSLVQDGLEAIVIAKAPRVRPRMVVAWTVGDGKKPYATKREAYYEIAKDLVIAKYPVWLHGSLASSASPIYEEQAFRPAVPLPKAYPPIKTPHQLALRRQKALGFFFAVDELTPPGSPTHNGLVWSSKRWKKHVRRVAKFLQFVDERTAMHKQLAHLDADDRRAQIRAFGARPYPMPYVRTPELVGFQRWVIGAYDKRISWDAWSGAKYSPRRLGDRVTLPLFQEASP
jgi:hypothetical protein